MEHCPHRCVTLRLQMVERYDTRDVIMKKNKMNGGGGGGNKYGKGENRKLRGYNGMGGVKEREIGE